jgi:hypothetical protein
MDFPAFDGTRLTDRIVGTGLLLICVPGGRAAPRSTSRNWAGSTGSVPSCSWTCGGRVSRPADRLAGIATSTYNSSTGSPTATRPPRTT